MKVPINVTAVPLSDAKTVYMVGCTNCGPIGTVVAEEVHSFCAHHLHDTHHVAVPDEYQRYLENEET